MHACMYACMHGWMLGCVCARVSVKSYVPKRSITIFQVLRESTFLSVN